jgi:hypothetical protein
MAVLLSTWPGDYVEVFQIVGRVPVRQAKRPTL